MKQSTVSLENAPVAFDTARKVRGAMGEERVTASDLSRTFGGAVTYWTRRITGQLPFTAQDLHMIALATRRHPAEFLGGEAPAGWTPPAPPAEVAATMASGARSSTDRASDYGSLVRLPSKPRLTLLFGGAA